MKTNKIIVSLLLLQQIASASQSFNPKLLPSFVALYDNQNRPPTQTLPAGTLDLTFGAGTGYVTTGASVPDTVKNSIASMAVDQQNSFITVGSVQIGDDAGPLNIALFKFLSDGTVDQDFGVGGYSIYNVTDPHNSLLSGVTIDANNGIIAAGTVGLIPKVFYLMRYLENGAIDTNFGGGEFSFGTISPYTNADNFAEAVTIDSQGRIIVVGYSIFTGISVIPENTKCFCVVRYNALGQVDTTFGIGIPGTDASSAGRGYSVYYDNTSGFDNIPYGVTTDAEDNIILVGGTGAHLEIVKFLATDGSLDTAFMANVPSTSGGDAILMVARSVGIDSAGNSYIAGGTFAGGYCLVKLLPDGALDTTFAAGGIFSETGFKSCAVVIDPLNRIVIMGYKVFIADVFNFVAIRVFSNGTLDTTFGPGGTAVFTSASPTQAFAGALDQKGRIIVAGNVQNGLDDSLPMLVAFTTDYSLQYYQSQFKNQPIGFL